MRGTKEAQSYFASFLMLVFLWGCNGGSSGSGILVEGTLTESGGAAHAKFDPKHGEGQRIEEVEICALSECSLTDGQGQWGFVLPESAGGAPALLSVKGHGIDSSAVLNIPSAVSELFVELHHVAGGTIEVRQREQ